MSLESYVPGYVTNFAGRMVPGLGSVLETVQIYTDYTKKASKIEEDLKRQQAIKKAMEKKQETPVTVTKKYKSRKLTQEEKASLGEKVKKLDGAITGKRGIKTEKK